MHKINENKKCLGEYHCLCIELQSYEDCFFLPNIFVCVKFSVNSYAIPYCPPGKSVSKTQMSTAHHDSEPKYTVIIPNRHAWAEGPRPPLVVMGLVQMASGCTGGWGSSDWILWVVLGNNAQYSPPQQITAFQAEIYATMACLCDIRMTIRLQKDIHICFDSKEALKVLAVELCSQMV